MRDARAVRQIAEEQTPRVIDHGIVRAVAGQYIDVALDGSGKQVRKVTLDKSIVEIKVGWWVTVVRHPRTNRWQAIAAYEDAAGGSVAIVDELPTPADATATGKPYLVEFSWSGSFQDVATYEIQHNSSASEAGATTIKYEGSNFLYWCAPGTTRHFRVRAVSSTFIRSAWSAWVNASSSTGEAYMTIGVNAGATGVEYQAFDWDLVSAVTAADMVHNHNTAAEGGVELWPDRLGVGTASIPAMDGVIGLAQASDHPPFAPDEGRIYVLDDSGDAELWYRDDSGRGTQLTKDGGLYGGSKVLMADGAWLGIGPGDERVVYNVAGYISVMGAYLGVETLTPGAPLEVSGSGPQARLTHTADTSFSAIDFYESASREGSIQLMGSNFVTASRRQNVEIWSRVASKQITFHLNSATPAMVIDPTGVGMNGVTSPSTALDIGAGAFELDEMTAPGGGAVNTCRLYAVDNGGKTELYAVFNTGAAQLIAAQP